MKLKKEKITPKLKKQKIKSFRERLKEIELSSKKQKYNNKEKNEENDIIKLKRDTQKKIETFKSRRFKQKKKIGLLKTNKYLILIIAIIIIDLIGLSIFNINKIKLLKEEKITIQLPQLIKKEEKKIEISSSKSLWGCNCEKIKNKSKIKCFEGQINRLNSSIDCSNLSKNAVIGYKNFQLFKENELLEDIDININTKKVIKEKTGLSTISSNSDYKVVDNEINLVKHWIFESNGYYEVFEKGDEYFIVSFFPQKSKYIDFSDEFKCTETNPFLKKFDTQIGKFDLCKDKAVLKNNGYISIKFEEKFDIESFLSSIKFE